MLTINKRQNRKGIEFSKKTFLSPRIYEQFMCCCKLLCAVANCYVLLQTVMCCCKLLRAVANCYVLLQTVMCCCKLFSPKRKTKSNCCEI